MTKDINSAIDEFDNKFKIDINNKNYFFENLPIFGYEYYRNWKQLTKKIISI